MPFLSHPSRVRGLKWKYCQFPALVQAVAPFTGAWIEIHDFTMLSPAALKSHPSRVRGLKYLIISGGLDRNERRTLHGCVD